ncbi:hypothetical protein CEUSTIGMA_g1797.t1 [Chlamydomonas eustigma]|uniref:arogenate dehydratase n=1 Tax=Chlamydomonas eustigma TaxID=1157962 RepID=A0A250WU47_9CHLO|nr:hypothetical protein CEUSTIGMA_g1797.t1 [Chlamydomonas eustigma]|eukprot:GAX74348.1 hypothetical protein CEUSTIGMA_g1797.t1 [Chlamydomonas eustigma]
MRANLASLSVRAGPSTVSMRSVPSSLSSSNRHLVSSASNAGTSGLSGYGSTTSPSWSSHVVTSAVITHAPSSVFDPRGTLNSMIIAQATNKTLDQIQPTAVRRTVGKAAYQGVPGAYSEVAALRACPDFDPMSCEQFETAFQALSQWLCDRAVLPIENSLGGSIHAVFDLLLRYRLHIVGEVSLSINHCLVALPGTKKGDITRVMSHPQALAQCDSYIRTLGITREAVDDTAGAAQMVSQQHLENVGAISSSRAAELYGLDIIEAGIQDVKENVTRFVVLSRDPLIALESDDRAYKTMIVFSLGEGPGQLFKALAVFALRDLDLLKIESRPLRSNPMVVVDNSGTQRFNYLFYADFIGKLSDEKVQNAMRHLQEIAPYVRVLGSFPMDTDLGGTNVESVFNSMRTTIDD